MQLPPYSTGRNEIEGSPEKGGPMKEAMKRK